MNRAAFLPMLAVFVLGAGCKKKTVSECENLRSEVVNEIAKGPGSCSTSSDCRRYAPSGVASCGGVANKATADKIDKLVGELESRHCDIGESACEGYWVQHADCVSGRCASVRNPAPVGSRQ